jgi:uncharacterized damage-inducible protein DinB
MLLDDVLDSWDRNNAILVNLLRLIPEGGLDARATPDAPTVSKMFTHIHYVRLVLVEENAPELATVATPKEEWRTEHDRERLANALNESAKVVRSVAKNRLETGRPMQVHYDHPLLFLQHLIWHEGYHHGQIKLLLKQAGHPVPDDVAGPVTWDVWMDRV